MTSSCYLLATPTSNGLLSPINKIKYNSAWKYPPCFSTRRLDYGLRFPREPHGVVSIVIHCVVW